MNAATRRYCVAWERVCTALAVVVIFALAGGCFGA
jgi:hypothetical protein